MISIRERIRYAEIRYHFHGKIFYFELLSKATDFSISIRMWSAFMKLS